MNPIEFEERKPLRDERLVILVDTGCRDLTFLGVVGDLPKEAEIGDCYLCGKIVYYGTKYGTWKILPKPKDTSGYNI